MRFKEKYIFSLVLAFFCKQSVGQFDFQSFEQPALTDVELAEKQLVLAAECKLKIDPKDPSINYLVAAAGGRLEHYSAPDKPYSVLGLQSSKIDTFVDLTGRTADTYTTYVRASMNTVKKKANLESPVETEIGTLSVKYSATPGMVEIVCKVKNQNTD